MSAGKTPSALPLRKEIQPRKGLGWLFTSDALPCIRGATGEGPRQRGRSPSRRHRHERVALAASGSWGPLAWSSPQQPQVLRFSRCHVRCFGLGVRPLRSLGGGRYWRNGRGGPMGSSSAQKTSRQISVWLLLHLRQPARSPLATATRSSFLIVALSTLSRVCHLLWEADIQSFSWHIFGMRRQFELDTRKKGTEGCHARLPGYATFRRARLLCSVSCFS